MKIYRALSALLHYPSAELVGAAGEIRLLINEDRRLSGAARKILDRLALQLADNDLLDAQETYVGLFDRSRSLSLHLFEHVHGESRDRGQAMVNLAAHYERHGCRIDANELPDYLPLFLEFLSLTSPQEASELLSDVVHILAAIRIRLERRGSDYAGVFLALEDLAGRNPDRATVEGLLKQDKPPAEEAKDLDKDWEEAPAFGGAAGNECGAARAALNRMAAFTAADRPANSTEQHHG